MSENKVITKEEMEKIEQLRSSSTDLIFEFGQTEMEIMISEKRVIDLKSHKEQLKSRYLELQENERVMVSSLNETHQAYLQMKSINRFYQRESPQ